MFGLATLPIAFGALSTGCVFGAMNIGTARNPEEKNSLFNNSMIAFALIETFVFIGIGLAFIAFLII